MRRTRPRFSLVALAAAALAVASSSAASAALLFADDFDRPDGSLGAGWVTRNDLGLPPVMIVEQKAAGDDHALALVATPVSASHVRVSFSFQVSDPEGFEVYSIARSSTGDPYVAGCDGGMAAGSCGPKIEKVGAVGASGDPTPLALDTPYDFVAEYDGGDIELTISSGPTVLVQLAQSTGATFEQFGIVVGRAADGKLTTIDDYAIEDLGGAATACGDAPRVCEPAGKASLAIANKGDDARDAFALSLSKAPAATLDELGRPTTTTGYAVCVYDERGLALHADVPPGGTCGRKPCWTTKRSHTYRDRAGTRDGITGMTLKPSTVATTALTARGKGASLDDPSRLPLVGTVAAQVVNLESGRCFDATFSGAEFRANDAQRFRAKR